MKEVQQIEPEHLRQLVRTISDATKRGVELDLHRENLLYDPTEGFTIIDYHLPGRYRRSTPGEAVGGVDMPLRTAGKEQILDDKSYARVAKTKNAPERFARQAEHLSVNIELLEKCLTAAKQELSDEEYKAASHEIEDSIDYYQSRQQNLNKFLRTESINH